MLLLLFCWHEDSFFCCCFIFFKSLYRLITKMKIFVGNSSSSKSLVDLNKEYRLVDMQKYGNLINLNDGTKMCVCDLM